MKHLILSAAALALLAGSAFAQETPAPSNAPAAAQAAPAQTTPPELVPDNNATAPAGDNEAQSSDEAQSQSDEMRADDMRSDNGRRWDRDGRRWNHGRRDRDGEGRRHHAGRSDGARFHIETGRNGEIDLNVRCAADEPMQACADVVNGLLDRLSNDEARDDSRSEL